MKIIKALFLYFLIIPFAMSAAVPKLTSPVIDQAGLLSKKQKRIIERTLQQVHKNIGPQVQVLTLKSLEGESIEEYAIKAVDKWQLGDKEKDDGLLFLISTGDRKMRIEVGDGLEGVMTDYESHKIIQGITPYFKSGQFGDGIIFGVKSILSKIGVNTGDIPVKRIKRRKKNDGASPIVTFIFFIVIFILRSRRGIFFSSGFVGGRYGSSGGFSSGGGSSWSGGGGSFSGGGSSGSW